MSHAHESTGSTSVACAVITVSDTRTQETDRSGKEILKLLKENGHQVSEYLILKDDPDKVAKEVHKITEKGVSSFILINGGTGISKRDLTVDAIENILEKRLPGFGELFRTLSYEEIGSATILSRATAGILKNKCIFCMPGSTKAVTLAMKKLILPELEHISSELTK